MSVQLLEHDLAFSNGRRSVPSQQMLFDFFGGLQSKEALPPQVLELQERVLELDAFARTVAHDLKGSLSSLIGFAIALQEDYAQLSVEEQHKCLDSLVHIAYKLNNIVDELLLLAEMRQAEVEIEPLYMERIVAQAQERLTPMIQALKAEVVLPATWPTAQGHGPWVEEVWVNYLSNAIKYGGLPPRVELGAQAQPDGMVCFWVRDNGGGLTSDAQARLFEPFTRLDRVRAQGHGLGLAVVRQIVEKLGGQVGVESVPRQGSVFSFTLPCYTG